jgi:hypothetical protein
MPNAINSLISLGRPEYWSMSTRLSKNECFQRAEALQDMERTKDYLTNARDLIPIPGSKGAPRKFTLFKLSRMVVMNFSAPYPPQLGSTIYEDGFRLWPAGSLFPNVYVELDEHERGTKIKLRLGRFLYRLDLLIMFLCASTVFGYFLGYYIVRMTVPGIAEVIFTLVLFYLAWYCGKLARMAWQTRRQTAEIVRAVLDAEFEDVGYQGVDSRYIVAK